MCLPCMTSSIAKKKERERGGWGKRILLFRAVDELEGKEKEDSHLVARSTHGGKRERREEHALSPCCYDSRIASDRPTKKKRREKKMGLPSNFSF